MVDLVPVDHQPEFDEADQAAMMPETFANPAVKAAIDHIASGTKKLVTAPGDIAKPNPYPEGSELASAYEDQRQKGMTDWSPQMALAMLGGGAAGVEGGGEVLGSGPARMRMIDNVDLYKELANQNRAKGYATGKAAEGHDFTRPGPEKGSVAETVAKMKAQLDADTHQSLLTIEQNRGIPNNPNMTADDWAFIDDNIRKGNPTLGSGATDKKTAATIQAIRGLDMNQDARLARAADQGYDTSSPLYHGTSKDADFKKFKDSRHGTWTTTDPESASMYARENDSKGLVYDRGKYEPVNSADRVLPLYGKPLQNPYTGPVPDSIRTASNYKKAQSDWFDQLKRQGYDGVDMGGGVRVDFDNANLRSQFAPFDPKNQGKSMLLGSSATDQKTAAMLQAIRAYHGSPHDFDAFDLSKIGTGEGAQAYGHGLYFAENEPVAKSYKAAGPAANAQYDAINSRLSALAKEMDANSSGYRNFKDKELGAKQAAEYDSLMAKKSDIGHMYEVNINADPEHFLDWDKPLAQQHPKVQEALNKVGGPATTQLPDSVIQGKNGRYYTMRGDQVLGRYDGWPDSSTANEALRVMKENAVPNYTFGEWQKKMNVPFPEEKLAQEGIPGIKYLDQGSRIGGDAARMIDNYGTREKALEVAQQRLKSAGMGDLKYWDGVVKKLQTPESRNYVVFNDKLIDILRKYGIAGLPAAGAATGAMQAQPGPADMVNAIRGQGGG